MKLTHCLSASLEGFKCNFSVNIIRSVFHRSTLVTRTGASVSDTYNAVNIVILQSTVFTFHLELKSYSADNLSLSVNKCKFTKITFKLPALSIPETQHHTASVNILLWRVTFQCYPKPCNMIMLLQFEHNSGEHNRGCRLLLPNITISHLGVQRGFFGFHVFGTKKGTNYKGCNGTLFNVLTVHNSVFQNLMPVPMIPLAIPAKKNAVITISNMETFLVKWTGKNKILYNKGCGIVLMNSIVHNNGYTVIEGNSEGGMLLQSDSLLLLSNNSVLKVHNNRDNGILSAGLSVAGTLSGKAASSLQLWPENDMCFFQFVDTQGSFIHSHELYNFQISTGQCQE